MQFYCVLENNPPNWTVAFHTINYDPPPSLYPLPLTHSLLRSNTYCRFSVLRHRSPYYVFPHWPILSGKKSAEQFQHFIPLIVLPRSFIHLFDSWARSRIPFHSRFRRRRHCCCNWRWLSLMHKYTTVSKSKGRGVGQSAARGPKPI